MKLEPNLTSIMVALFMYRSAQKNLGTSLLHSIWYKLEHDLVVVGIAGLQYGIDFFLGMFWSRINKAILIDPICLKLFIGLPVNSWHNLF